MTLQLQIGPDGRVTGPAAITYNDPFPTGNGSWGSGAMMGVVMHTMVGNLQPETTRLFNDPHAAVSAHFGIDQDGSVWQFGPIGKGWIAWAEMAGNAAWYSIEHADGGDTTSPLTGEQLIASAQLVEVLSRFAGFPLQVTDSVDVQGYGTHVMGGAAWGGHTCPGPGPRAGQRYQIISRATAIRAGQATWTSDGSLSLAELAAQYRTQPSTILAVTAAIDGAFAADAAVYIDAVFTGTIPEQAGIPAGTVLWIPGN